MNGFESFSNNVDPTLGSIPQWVVEDWLKEALKLKPNAVFRQRILHIHKYLSKNSEAMTEQLLDEYNRKQGVTSEQEQPSGFTSKTVH